MEMQRHGHLVIGTDNSWLLPALEHWLVSLFFMLTQHVGIFQNVLYACSEINGEIPMTKPAFFIHSSDACPSPVRKSCQKADSFERQLCALLNEFSIFKQQQNSADVKRCLSLPVWVPDQTTSGIGMFK
jgi:hypothetical protein